MPVYLFLSPLWYFDKCPGKNLSIQSDKQTNKHARESGWVLYQLHPHLVSSITVTNTQFQAGV